MRYRLRRWWPVIRGALIGLVLAGAVTAVANTYRITYLEREADARICARENLVRAEIHVAYQNPQNSPKRIPPQVRSVEPLLLQLLKVGEKSRQDSLKRVRRLLPILDCSPNFHGESAKPYSVAKQRNFVKQYQLGKLDPTPEASDVKTGPDE